jgi:hypothetical protein
MVAETEEVGNETIQELGRNREAIESARAKVRLLNRTIFKFFSFLWNHHVCTH